MSPPPPGPPWDLPLDEAPLAFVDIEMTGLDLSLNRVVEVCVERVTGRERTGFVRTLIDPGSTIGERPTFTESTPQPWPALRDSTRSPTTFCGPSTAPCSWPTRPSGTFASSRPNSIAPAAASTWFIGSTRSFSRGVPSAFHSHSLDSLCRELGIDRGQAHRAESDVRAMREVFDRCVALLRPTSVRDLWEVRVGDRRARAVIVELCEAAVKDGTPVIVTYRAARRAPESFAMVVREVRSELDPPRVVGYQLPGRGRKELRADRILRVEPAPVTT